MYILKRFILCFLFIYLFLYIFPFPLGYLPFGIGKFFNQNINQFWRWLTPIFSEYVFGHTDELSFQGRGSGDTLFNYFLTALKLVMALMGTVIWSIVDKFKTTEEKIFQYSILFLRYFLAFTMFSYGFLKIFYLQFPELNLMNLTRTYGDSSPMGLLWKFMGYSEGYSIFTGVAEVLGGIFLLFRKTKILGAMLIFGVMLNVFVMNMTFDVPVKLFSFHLCVISLVILIPDFENILNFFLLNRPTSPNSIQNYSKKRINNRIGLCLKFLFIVYVLYGNIDGKLKSQKRYGKRVPKNQLYGIYEVNSFIINQDTVPPLTTDNLRWKTLIVDKQSSLVINMDGTRIGMKHTIDTIKKSLDLNPYLKKYRAYSLNYVKNDSTMMLKGNLGGDTLQIFTERRNRDDFFLINRGFHWINEYPMQR